MTASSGRNPNLGGVAQGIATFKIQPPAFNKEKLNGVNYTLGKFKITIMFYSYKLLNRVLERDQDPHATASRAYQNVMIPLYVEALHGW